ncbi:hypothetical protein UFOVP250_71 [uncultured Caudovirales phage]|uniref:Uncharacterized protein n=1 Tax=uncultured Caudovirales phage TaxID=2100421 RepID=A0A6J5LJE5_9CAUD|nr:hypothetical protein UFOVP250_71 [uncultured Caudovirales phage]
MKKFVAVLLLAITLAFSGLVDAKGGSSSGGGGHGFSGGGSHSFSGGGSKSFSGGSFSSGSGNKGGFSSSSRPSSTTTTRTVTSSRSSYSSSRGGYYGGGYVHPGMMYGGWGMGYGYSNGLLTGLIIADMMHPQGTVMYNGGGQYNNNALLYPDGRVVNQQGYQVGTYQNGQFTAVDGGMVAQPVPQDAVQPAAPPQAQPVIIQQSGISDVDIALISILMFFMMVCIIGVFL